MNNGFFRQLSISVRIWLLAILFNSIFGTLWIWQFGSDTEMIMVLMIIGSMLGLVFSIPVLLTILIAINILVRKKATGRQICLTIYACGLLLTIFSFILFGRNPMGDVYHFIIIGELAGALAITLQYQPLKKLGSDFSPTYQFDYEN